MPASLQITVDRFGPPDVLEVRGVPVPEPGPGQVRVRLTSIGLNHADLMGREGRYKISTGDPPFTPGLEGGGVIDALGQGVADDRLGQRVTLAPDVPRRAGGGGGTYRSHYVCDAAGALPVPDTVPDDQLGALWLAYLTAWGCLVWKHGLSTETGPGTTVALPAASSSAALAAAQLARHHGCTTLGLTTSPDKTDALADHYDHLIVTHDADDTGKKMRPFHRDLYRLTDGRGVDLFYDPVASGAYLDTEIKALADRGTVWVYGLLGTPGPVDVTPLIRKHAALRGWALTELINAGPDAWRPGVNHILDRFADGTYRQTLAHTYPLADARRAHTEMAEGRHVGKLVLIP